MQAFLLRHSVWRVPSTLKGMTQGPFFHVVQPSVTFASKGMRRTPNILTSQTLQTFLCKTSQHSNYSWHITSWGERRKECNWILINFEASVWGEWYPPWRKKPLVFRFSVVHRLWVGGSLLPAGASSSSTKGRAMFVCLPSGAQPESCTPSRRNSPHWARKWSFRPLPRNTPSLSLGNFTEEIAMITKPIAPNWFGKLRWFEILYIGNFTSLGSELFVSSLVFRLSW